MLRRTLPCIVAFITSFASSAGAASVPWYHYHRDTLILRFWARTEAAVSLQWQAVAKNGQPSGPIQRQRVETKRGANEIKLTVGKAGGHRVQLRVDGRNIRVWCNRGVWAAGPGGLDIERVRSGKATALPYRYVGLADIQLARGFQANVRAVTAAAPLALERSFGYPRSLGIRPPAGMALVLVAKGTVGPVQLVLGQRTRKGIAYYDYFLVLDPHYRRFVIPLSHFRSRSPRRVAIRAIHSAAILTTTAVRKTGASVTVGFYGLGYPGPRVVRVVGTNDGMTVKLTGGRAGTRIIRHAARTDKAKPAEVPVGRRAAVKLTTSAPQKLWLCHRYRKDIEVCDPPDAPHTHYLGQPGKTPPLLIDDFLARTNVNAHRQPVTRFASNAAVRHKMKLTRGGGLLRWSVTLRRGAYAGFHTDLPSHRGVMLDGRSGQHSLQLRLRGTIAARYLEVHLVNRRGRPAKINLGQYTDQLSRWRLLSIPLDAFSAAYRSVSGRGRFGAISRLSLAAVARKAHVNGTIELDWIRLSPQRGPTTIATFDSGDHHRNALAGRIGTEAMGGAQLDLAWEGEGKHGKSLGVTARSVGEKAYAILIFGLGGLDTRRHRHLSFWIRGARGGEQPIVILASGRNRKAVNLTTQARVSQTWQQVRIPLEGFGKEIRRNLRQLIFSWERRTIVSETIHLDSIRLE